MTVSHCDTRWKRTSIVSRVAEQFGRFITTLNTISLFQLNKTRLSLQTHQNVPAWTLKTKVLSSFTSHPTRIPNINELHSLTQFAHHTPSSVCCLGSRLSKYNNKSLNIIETICCLYFVEWFQNEVLKFYCWSFLLLL